ncbi:Alpha/Beta hydrolase protein [Pilobolus umbonatus]|nr:Alpha/Beta hydrolase protein [Pilobolus umbonatus]
MYLQPTSSHIIPVSPTTFGYDIQKLAVDVHEYPATTQEAEREVFLFSHSNGFHKEAFHPLMKTFIEHLRSLAEYHSIHVTFVSWDARNHGDSARYNEGTLLDSYRWFDHAMDTKQVIDYMELTTKYNRLFGVGHSFGATSMILSEFMYPNTFDGLVLVEPVMRAEFSKMELERTNPVLMSRKRRDEWPSREVCRENLSKKRFFQLLHPGVLDNYINYGLYDTDKGTVKLKCLPEQEYHIFMNHHYATFTAHKSLRNIQLPAHFVYALDSNFVHPDDSATIIGENTKQITLGFVEGTHMVPNETPEVIVPQIMRLIGRVKGTPHDKAKM